MGNKKYLPSIGFIILLVTVILSIFFIKWILGPLSYEKPAVEKKLKHIDSRHKRGGESGQSSSQKK